MSRRRDLRFENLDQVMPEVDRLLEGYHRAGAWSLGQISQHLARSLEGSIAGLPGRAPWLVRKTIGPWFGRHVLGSGRMPTGIKLRPEWGLKPGADLEDRVEVEALRAAIAAYTARVGALPEHPFFGPLRRDQWDRLHCVHCAHHLSFLSPASPDARQAGRD